jgi:hypothetical protein
MSDALGRLTGALSDRYRIELAGAENILLHDRLVLASPLPAG